MIQTVPLVHPGVPHGTRIMMHLLLWQLELPEIEEIKPNQSHDVTSY